MEKIADFYKGDTKTYNFAFTDSTGAVIDITGATLYGTFKTSPDDLDAAAIVKKVVTSHTSPTVGLTTLTLTATDTNLFNEKSKYFYDFTLKDAAGVVTTIISDKVKILTTITKDVT